VVILHPTDAGRRGLAPDDEVELFNDLGSVSMRLRVSDEIAPGVVLVPGQRPAGEAVAGTVNLLCSDRLSDLGEGATYQSTFLDVKRAVRVLSERRAPPSRRPADFPPVRRRGQHRSTRGPLLARQLRSRGLSGTRASDRPERARSRGEGSCAGSER
jgi:predicted molibdopterin-dependent oxidoreductase YjgC